MSLITCLSHCLQPVGGRRIVSLQDLSIDIIANDLQDYDDGRRIHPYVLDAQQVQLQLAFREVVAAEILHGFSHAYTAVDLLREALSILRSEAEQSDQHRYQATILANPTLGRPRFNIPYNPIAFLLESRFCVPRIADILGVSVRTIRQRMSEYGLSVQMFYSDISDTALNQIVEEIQLQFPTCDNRQMQGHLLSRGIRVQQHRIRELQRQVDPAGSVMRRLRIIHRRQYHVNGPRALWHIDGNYKLLR